MGIVGCGLLAGCGGASDISFFVLVKSSNYAQDSGGALTLLNYHFFSEIFLEPEAVVTHASLAGPGWAGEKPYEDRGDNFYVEGGHFDTIEELDAAHPNGEYRFTIVTTHARVNQESLTLAGPGGRTDIPAPITISLWQTGERVSPLGVDPARDVVVRWSEYSNAVPDPRGIVDDMIFVVVADCHGDRMFHTGLPFREDYMTFRATEIVVPAGRLAAGRPYSMFVEFPHVVDSRVMGSTPGFTSYATATYLDLRTAGPRDDSSCPEVAPPMDTGQTDRIDPVR